MRITRKIMGITRKITRKIAESQKFFCGRGAARTASTRMRLGADAYYLPTSIQYLRNTANLGVSLVWHGRHLHLGRSWGVNALHCTWSAAFTVVGRCHALLRSGGYLQRGVALNWAGLCAKNRRAGCTGFPGARTWSCAANRVVLRPYIIF